MAHWCRAALLLIAATVVARSSVTISWNTRTAAQTRSQSSAPVVTATVVRVSGTHVVLRLGDGTTRLFIATPDQARTLEHLTGTAIQFRLSGTRHQ